MKRFALALPLMAFAAVASANIVVNSSFEQPNLGHSYILAANDGVAGGWYASQGRLEIGYKGFYGVTGVDGNQICELDSDQNSTISQDLSTVASHYQVSFLSAARGGVDPASCAFAVYWGNQLLDTITPGSTTLTNHSYTVNGAAGTTTLSFKALGASDSLGTIVDKVNVEAVPEPCSMAALGLGGLALLRRRRAKKA